ncbi:MAG: hypothetical protein KJ077_45880 [Anaerolineae bacterium]|nr:hypothetical protein [Anaerolineae bacterium]
MIYKTLEVSLSKEEQRIVDERGNIASTWARIGFTVELEPGDIPDMCIKQLKDEIQPEVDAWLLNQGGYITSPREEVQHLPELIEEIQDEMDDLFGIETKVTEVVETGDDENSQ